jgi:hypothetical protein
VCDFGCPIERVHLVGVSISFEKNFYRLPFTPTLSGRLIGPSPVRVTGLTGQSSADVAALFCSSGLHAFVQGARMCAGGSLCGFRALVWWFALFA